MGGLRCSPAARAAFALAAITIASAGPDLQRVPAAREAFALAAITIASAGPDLLRGLSRDCDIML